MPTFCEGGNLERQIEDYVAALRANAHTIGGHGLDRAAFDRSGLFRAAIERIRGTQSATMTEKKEFLRTILSAMQAAGSIRSWEFAGHGERHDYQVTFADGRVSIFEAKGCLDGNNTNIYERPANADEFLIWSLCQNAGADPRANVWSGIHTRLSAEIIHAPRKQVDALIVFDMLCGTLARPCPKLLADPQRGRELGGVRIPPPCIYLFPRTVPDGRNNPAPQPHDLPQVKLAEALHTFFGGQPNELTQVWIEARHQGADVQRKTRLVRGGLTIRESTWTTVRRARG
jgi:hypothetical protein